MGNDQAKTGTGSEKGLTCVVIDDDVIITKTVASVLEHDGWRVLTSNDSIAALELIELQQPDCIVADIMMPHMDGLELCKKIREHAALKHIPFVVLSGKSYEYDRKRAYETGASGYITKPIDLGTFAGEIRGIINDKVAVNFWGVRGTLPVPGERSVRYGGNTSCVSMNFSRGRSFIFDAGTGIKVLSDHLLKTAGGKTSSTIFISHSHWDHINALPFFVPLYISGNEFEICGPAQGSLTVYDIISAQMSDVYFPITIKEFAASIRFRDLHQDSYTIDGIQIETMMLNHPGYCLGYRINYNNRSICYVTDNELYPKDDAHFDAGYHGRLADFIRGCDALITDSTYFEEEYQSKSGWGHSSINEVADLAHHAGVGTLFLFHHDPDQTDDDIDRKVETVRRRLEEMGSTTVCVAPAEKQTYMV